MTRAEEIERLRPPTAAFTSATRPPTLSGNSTSPVFSMASRCEAEVDTTSGRGGIRGTSRSNEYAIDLKLHARVPTPNRTVDELAESKSRFRQLLPGLATMAKRRRFVFVRATYRTQSARAAREPEPARLLLSRHNFLRLPTVLTLKHPETKTPCAALSGGLWTWMRMVDGDRVPAGNGVSPTFKPFTSFVGEEIASAESVFTRIEDRCIAWKWSKGRQRRSASAT